jgi:hypothetical protein
MKRMLEEANFCDSSYEGRNLDQKAALAMPVSIPLSFLLDER